jgi:hypothetical protein
MPRSYEIDNTMIHHWRSFENDTLIHNHKMAKSYKKRYQRAADLQSTLYRFFGLIAVVSSSVASTLAWGVGESSSSSFMNDENSNRNIIISTITTVSAVSSAIQNFYKFQENANNNITTAKSYAKLQNKIEIVGNIHPEYRKTNPNAFLKKIHDKFDQISDTRDELSNRLIKYLYTQEDDNVSYLEKQHEKYGKDNDEEKLEYSNHAASDINIQVETDTEEEELQ